MFVIPVHSRERARGGGILSSATESKCLCVGYRTLPAAGIDGRGQLAGGSARARAAGGHLARIMQLTNKHVFELADGSLRVYVCVYVVRERGIREGGCVECVGGESDHQGHSGAGYSARSAFHSRVCMYI